MPQRSTDKRSERSRRAIEDALITLLKVQPLEKISVTSLIKQAGYSRTAFYNNYLDINDCLDSIIDTQAENFYLAYREAGKASAAEAGPVTTEFGNAHELVFRGPYEAVYNNKDVFTVLYKRLPRGWMYSFIEKVTARIDAGEQYEAVGAEPDMVNTELWVWSHVYDTLGRIVYWMDHDMIYSPEYMGRQQYLKRRGDVYLVYKDSGQNPQA